MPTAMSEGLSHKRRQLRALKGVAVRLGHEDEAAKLDTEIRTERLADAIEQTVATFPALSLAQRDRLARLLQDPDAG